MSQVEWIGLLLLGNVNERTVSRDASGLTDRAISSTIKAETRIQKPANRSLGAIQVGFFLHFVHLGLKDPKGKQMSRWNPECVLRCQRVFMKGFSQFRSLVGNKGHGFGQIVLAHGGLEIGQ